MEELAKYSKSKKLISLIKNGALSTEEETSKPIRDIIKCQFGVSYGETADRFRKNGNFQISGK